MLISFIRSGSDEASAARRRDLTFSNPRSLLRKASMAKESSKLLLRAGIILSPFLEKSLGQGRPAPKHAAGRLDGIVGNRLDDNFPSVGQGHEHFPPWPKPDPLPKLRRDDHLPLRRGFYDWHFRSPNLICVQPILNMYNASCCGCQANTGQSRPLSPRFEVSARIPAHLIPPSPPQRA